MIDYEVSFLELLQEEDRAVKRLNHAAEKEFSACADIENARRKMDYFKKKYGKDKELLFMLLKDKEEEIAEFSEEFRDCKKEEEETRKSLAVVREKITDYADEIFGRCHT